MKKQTSGQTEISALV